MTEKDRILLQAQIERSTYETLQDIADRNERSLAAQIRFVLAQFIVQDFKDRQRIKL